MTSRVELYDVTLRDGAQGPGVKFSPEDQLAVVSALDAFGVAYIEGGQAGSNPKASEFFERAADMALENAVITAFGSTHHPRYTPEDDPGLQALLAARTPVVTIVAKASAYHVREVLRVSNDDNLRMTADSVAYLRAQGKRVFLDAEHYFDGYDADPAYALACLEAAHAAGAEALILCDTNGGQLPHAVAATMHAAHQRFPEAALGIHAHNDTACAVANTLAAVHEGATQVQGTINGYGERTGNANLISIVADLQLKMGRNVVSADQLTQLTHLSHLVAELANMAPQDNAPFVGRHAFTHKGGLHADAVMKKKDSYEHVEPGQVGNETHIAVSELAGRSSLLQKAAELGTPLQRNTPETAAILSRIKQLESEGLEFEGADASLELLIRKAKGHYRTFFTLEGFQVSAARHGKDLPTVAIAAVSVGLPDGTFKQTTADGDGPIDALNQALRKALEPSYPELRDVHLDDYKVRILDAVARTSAKTRVLMGSSDQDHSWSTVGLSENIITASYEALVDSIEYKLLKSRGHEA